MKLRHVAPMLALGWSFTVAAAPVKPADSELQQFVLASVEVTRINAAMLAKREAATSAAAAEKIEDEATATMEAAIKAKGMSAERYAEIYVVMEADPAIKARVAQLAKPHRK